ncbi:MAG: hypothetical protein DHS20C18_00360 [Saprospiraceae bacterium]|nr:MAG: hypothetical protein DHS20C18_00360 [Saprospiraceae bacterium]
MKHSAQIVTFLFFTGFFLLGMKLVPDYGISYDEDSQRSYGFIVAQHINEWFPFSEEQIEKRNLLDYDNRYHGPIFTTTAYFLEQWLSPNDYREKMLLRHRMTFILFWLATFIFYQLGKFRFGDWRWALLGSLCLILSPRIFGHSFFNPKDIPMLCLYLLASWTLLQLLKQKSWPLLVLHALACGLAISMRITGLALVALTLFFLILDWVNEGLHQKTLMKNSLMVMVFPLLAFLFATAFWPTLWSQPLYQMGQAFTHMAKFNWEGNILFQGGWVKSTELPMYYPLWWMVISIPLIYLFFFLVAFAKTIYSTGENLFQKQKIYRSVDQQTDLVLLSLIVVPLLAVIIKRAVLYDGWRHLFFIYPALLMLALVGFRSFWQQWLSTAMGRQMVLRFSFWVISGLFLGKVAWDMVYMHPMQYVYFNELADDKAFGNYEIDYWGLSYKQGFEALLASDQRDSIFVDFGEGPVWPNYFLLAKAQQKRIFLTKDRFKADYYITNYRYWNDWREAYRNGRDPFTKDMHLNLSVKGQKVLSIFKVTSSNSTK